MLCYKSKEQYLEDARSSIQFALQCLEAISVLPVQKKETYEKPFEKISEKHIPDV